MIEQRIFVIGLAKTATSSLHKAFKILGYKSCHHIHRGTVGKKLLDKAKAENKPLLTYMNQYDAYSDMGLINYLEELDLQYPNSKYILTTRDKARWLNSKIKHDEAWNKQHPQNPQRILDEQRITKLAANYDEMHKKALSYFEGKSQLLIIDITKGDGWEKLCPFLDKPIPKISFPFENAASRSLYEKLIFRIKRTIYSLIYRGRV